MRTSIDAAGRLVIPKSFRDALGVGRGGEVDIEFTDGYVVVSCPEVRKRLVERDGRAIIVAEEPLPPLTDEVVDDVLRSVRR